MLRQAFHYMICRGNGHECTKVHCSDNEQFRFDPNFSFFLPFAFIQLQHVWKSASIVFKTGSSALLLRVKARHTTPYIVLRAKTKIVKRTKAFVAEKKVERRWPRPLITEGHVLKQKMSVLEVFEWIKTNFNETVAAKFKGKLKSNSTE